VVGLIKDHGLIAFRDPFGIRPLVIGKRTDAHQKDEYIVASEDTMFHMLDFTPIGDIERGEIVLIAPDGSIQRRVVSQHQFSPCVFEYVYFSRPDAIINDVSVYRSRLRMGENLGKYWKERYGSLRPDVIIPAPSTSNTMALAMAKELDIPYSEGLYKNPFIGRTFIMPDQALRRQSVRYKLTPQRLEIKNKVVMIVDDSIVRGTTSREIISMVRSYGAKQVWFASACPPVMQPCFYGVDIPTSEELIASRLSLEAMREYLGADILLYQKIEDLLEAVMRKGNHHIDTCCHACLGGPYVAGCR
jgi:amidophosphoribosyltransferase